MDRLKDSFADEWQSAIDLAPQVVLALVVLLVFVVIGRLAARGLGLALERGGLTVTHQRFFRRLLSWAAALFGLAMALNVLGLGGVAAGLVAGGGLTAVMLGFAFRQIGENLLAGLFLAFSSPFSVDDYIESDGLQGTVREIELRHTHIRTPDGRDIFIPNARIFNTPLVNFTRDGLLRGSFTVDFDYRDTPGRALEILKGETAAVAGVLDDPAVAAYITSIGGGTVNAEVHFWVRTRESSKMAVTSDVLEACRAALTEAGYAVRSEWAERLEVVSAGTGEEPAEPSGGPTTAARRA
ncbi:MAG: mechanosensitive ion channel family protein [Thermoanaerobaculia bacterium]